MSELRNAWSEFRGQLRGPRAESRSEAPEEVINPEASSSVIQTMANAYYPQLITQPEAARNRAQAAFSIATAIATALIGLSIFADFGSLRGIVQVLGVLALLTWVASAGLYIRAVAAPALRRGLRESTSIYDFANAILSNALAERDTIDLRQQLARFVGGIAAVLTFITLATAIIVKPQPELWAVDVAISEDARKGLQQLCTSNPATLRGTIEDESLDRSVIAVRLDPGVCRKEAVTAMLRKEQVQSIVSR